MSSFTEKKGKMPSGQIAVALSLWEGLAFSREPSACESWSVNKPGKCWVSPSVTESVLPGRGNGLGLAKRSLIRMNVRSLCEKDPWLSAEYRLGVSFPSKVAAKMQRSFTCSIS